MILKRPYAFLIKHFRLIHMILLFPLIYLVRKSHLIVKFFNDYVANKYTFQTGSDISSLYISGLMFFAIIIFIVAVLAIYYLLKFKEKPVKTYVVMMIFYIVLFIFLFWYSGIISSMSKEVLEAKTARLYRDLSIIIYLPQYIFLCFVSLRAVGFNIKKFNFDSDLKELAITSEDNEEVEVGFQIDGYKSKRFFRRLLRELKYYVVENKFMVTVILIILIFTSILLFYNTRPNYDIVYSQNDEFMHQNFKINVKDSIITNMAYDGSKVSDELYLVLKTNIVNQLDKKKKLDYNNFIVMVGDRKLTPVLDRSSYFLDYGEPYYGDFIKTGKDQDYALVYRIKDSEAKKDFTLRVLSSYHTKDNKLVTKYANVKLTPVIIGKINDIATYDLKDKISFGNTNVGQSLLTVNNFQISGSYIYQYQKCYSENDCITQSDIVSPDYKTAIGNSSLIILDYEFDFDKDTSYAKYRGDENKFFDDFVTVKIEKNKEFYELDVKNITPDNLEGKLVLQVSYDLSNEKDVDLLFTIRNKRYTLNLR